MGVDQGVLMECNIKEMLSGSRSGGRSIFFFFRLLMYMSLTNLIECSVCPY